MCRGLPQGGHNSVIEDGKQCIRASALGGAMQTLRITGDDFMTSLESVFIICGRIFTSRPNPRPAVGRILNLVERDTFSK
jgi:hypothetical protein